MECGDEITALGPAERGGGGGQGAPLNPSFDPPKSVTVKLGRSSSMLRAPRESKAPTTSEHSI